MEEITVDRHTNTHTLVTPSLSCAQIHSLSSDWERWPCPSKYFDFISVCVFVCLPTVISSIFGKSSHFPFPYFVLFELRYFSSTWSNIASCAIWLWNMVTYNKGGRQAKDVFKRIMRQIFEVFLSIGCFLCGGYVGLGVYKVFSCVAYHDQLDSK